ncbi:unnamed protein product, partial [Amoebophrya sp. A120]
LSHAVRAAANRRENPSSRIWQDFKKRTIYLLESINTPKTIVFIVSGFVKAGCEDEKEFYRKCCIRLLEILDYAGKCSMTVSTTGAGMGSASPQTHFSR